MAKMKWNKAVQKALQLHEMRNTLAYFYGAKNVLLTKSSMDKLVAAEPAYFAQYTAEELKQIYRNSMGKIGLDCSAFVVSCIDGCPVKYSTALIEEAKNKTTPAAGVAGSLLYKSKGGRHIGLDIGYGFVADMGRESTDKAVKEGTDSVRIRQIGTGWEVSGQSPYIDYSGADAR